MQAGRIILRPDLLQLNEPLSCPLHCRLIPRLELGISQEPDERGPCRYSQSKPNGSAEAEPDQEECRCPYLPRLIR